MIVPEKRSFLRENGLYLLVLIGLLALPFLIGWATESSPYGVPRGDRMIMRGESVRWQAVMIEIFIIGILTMSYNLMFGFTGILSFGHALFYGLSGYIVGLMLEYTGIESNLALFLGIIISVVVNALLGILIGLVSLRLKGVYFAIFTLAVSEMFWIYFRGLSLTRAEDGFALSHLPTWVDPTQNRLTFYYIVLIVFVGVFVFIRKLIHSPTGAVFQAIRENENRAQAIGYDTLKYKLLSIMFASIMAALAGVAQIMLNKKVGPELLSVTNTVDPLLMNIIGGIGTFTGPVIGSAGLHLLDTVLREATLTIGGTTIQIANIWGLILGAIFIIAVIIFPQGIVGTWKRMQNWFRTRGSKPLKKTGTQPSSSPPSV